MSAESSCLDVKDRKILFELDKNARASLLQIGKSVGLSPEVVHYRVGKLRQSGVISQYHTTINYARLGLKHFKICLCYNGMTLQQEEALYAQLSRIPNVIWIAKCQGDFDCMLSVTVNSMAELDRMKDRIISMASSHIRSKYISMTSAVWNFPRVFLANASKQIAKSQAGETAAEVDETDLKILRILSEDARMPAVEIAKKVSVSAKVVATRIMMLQKKGIVNSFRLVLGYDKAGISFYKTFIYLKNPDEQRTRQLVYWLNMHPNVVINMKVIGEWELEPEFEFEKKEDFKATMQQLMDEFSDIIQRIGVVDIIKEYKYTYFYK